MSKWLTEAQLKADWGSALIDRLADRDGDGDPDAGVIAAKIEIAESRAEARLLTRYAPGDLPTVEGDASQNLKRVVSRLAFVALHDVHDQVGENVRSAEAQAMSELTDIARGHSSLLLASTPSVDLSAADVQRASGSSLAGGSIKGTFSAESLLDY